MADVIARLKLESGEFDSKIKRATEGLLAMERECRSVGGTLAYLEKDQMDFIKNLGRMETTATTTRGKINEMTNAFTEWSMVYKRMTDEEKNSQPGRALSASLDQLKTRIGNMKQDLSDVNNELAGLGNVGKGGNQFSGILDALGQKMGITGNLSEIVTSKTAMMYAGIAAGSAIVGKATQEFAKYNSELARQDEVTTVTTGLKGADADMMTDVARAMKDTYGVEFRDTINAANTLMTQFGLNGQDAMQLIRDGMQGMIQGDGPKLLQMIQQYAPSFRDAGITAEQLVAIIHNSEGGIFTDQNMNAITMGIKNIRLMTTATSDALAKLGIDGEEMTQKLNNGTITVFDAMKQVMHAVQGVGSGSQAAGEVMNYVFGRQGAAAGTNLAKAIENLNLNLAQTKLQTGEVGDAFAELQQANERLNTSIREAFSYDGWDQMAQGIKAKLVTALAAVVDKLGDIKNFFALGGFAAEDFISNKDVQNQLKKLQLAKNTGSTYSMGNLYKTQMQEYSGRISGLQGYMDEYDKSHSSVNKILQQVSREYGKKFHSMEDVRNLKKSYENSMSAYQKGADLILNAPKIDTKITAPTKTTTPTGGGSHTTTTRELDVEQQTQADINALLKEALTADQARQQQIRAQVAELQEQQSKYKDIKDLAQGILPKDREAVFTFNAELDSIDEAVDSLRGLDDIIIDDKAMTITATTSDALKKVQEATKEITDMEVTITPKVELPKGQEAVFTFTADDTQLQQVLDELKGVSGVTIPVNVAPANDSATATADQAASGFAAGTTSPNSPALAPATITVTADTTEALRTVQQAVNHVEGMEVDMKIQPHIEPQEVEITYNLKNEKGLKGHIDALKKKLAETDFGTPLYNSLTEKLADANMLSNLVEQALKSGVNMSVFDTTDESGRDLWTRAREGTVTNSEWQGIGDTISDTNEQQGRGRLSLDYDSGDVTESKKEQDESVFEQTEKVVSGLSQVASGLQQMGIKLPDGVTKVLGGMQGLMTVINGVQSIVSLFGTTTATAQIAAETGNTAAVVANTAAMVGLNAQLPTLIAALYTNAFTPFANGGVVHAANGYVDGNTYSGDKIPALLNAGELVLSRSQTGILSSALAEADGGNGGGNVNARPYVSGENIYLGINNHLGRSGQGEIVTTKMLRQLGLTH